MWAHSTMFIEIAVKSCALTLDLFLLSSNTATKISDIQKWLPLIFFPIKKQANHFTGIVWMFNGFAMASDVATCSRKMSSNFFNR